MKPLTRPPKEGFGYIYILSNSAMPSVYKIGLTRNKLSERIRDLSSVTGVPKSFKLEKAYEVPSISLERIEKRIHSILTQKGFHFGKEYFKTDLDVCKIAVEDVIFQITGIETIEIVGEAQKRHLENLEKQKKEEARRAALDKQLQKENSEIQKLREAYIARVLTPKEESVQQTSTFSNLLDGVYTVIGIGFIGFISFALGAIFLPLALIFPLGIYWSVWSEDKSMKEQNEKRKQEAAREAALKYPFKKHEDIRI